jgi:hypothetical protein
MEDFLIPASKAGCDLRISSAGDQLFLTVVDGLDIAVARTGATDSMVLILALVRRYNHVFGATRRCDVSFKIVEDE